WLLPRVPAPERPPAPGVAVPVVRRPNPLPALERWKVLDNLRRSLVPPALVVLLALGWTALPGGPRSGTLLALAVLGVAVALAALVVVWGQPAAVWAALPLTVAWLVSRWLAYAVSGPRRVAVTPLTEPEERELRRLARKTWAFFEAFVTAEEHWLPPDN